MLRELLGVAAGLAFFLAAVPGAAASGDAKGEATVEAVSEAVDSGSGGSGFGDLSFTASDEPIVVEADKLEFDYEKNRLIYRGEVHVVQGDFELESNVLIVTFDRADELESAQLRRVVAQGEVVITQGERRASGDRAVFDQGSRQIVLLGNPVLRDGPNQVQGDRLTVYLDEGRSVVESSPKKRVSAVLFPGEGPGTEPAGKSAVAAPVLSTPSPVPVAPAGATESPEGVDS